MNADNSLTFRFGKCECGKDFFDNDTGERSFHFQIDEITAATVFIGRVAVMENDAGLSESIKLRLESFEALVRLVRAVKCKEFSGIYCDDIDGVNWFDAVDELLGKAAT